MSPEIIDLNDYQIPEWPTTPEGEERQAREMEDMYRFLFAHPLVEAITGWDFTDGAWLGAPSGVITVENRRKPSYEMLHHLIHEEWRTVEEIRTDENGFAISYNSDNNTATLFEYFGTEKKVTVPNGITETEMGCFSNNEVIEEVVFPESFKKLGGGCFNNCPNLKKVVFPARTEDFYLDAFYGSDNVVIYAPPDSETKKFANIKRIPFQAI